MKKMKRMRERETDLANPGIVIFEESVTPWDQPEIDNGDESILKDLGQAIYHEVRTVRAESFIVQ